MSPCIIARETPWHGCVSLSLRPAVDAGGGGWVPLRMLEAETESEPCTTWSKHIPLYKY
ncbi:hypothetical protein J4Q44_G00108570 [Coregonus suidteri]|uniref:Uncharacterized protein n=1 Tax=Coregonus suidteri TaxID=861788 RepID=A0AAN8M7X1_9TELE